MNYSLRDIREGDKEWLYELNKESYHEVVTRQFGGWVETFQRQLFLDRWQSTRTGQIIELRSGEQIGVVILEKRSDCYWLQEIQIISDQRGHGLGTLLIQQFLGEARSRGRPLRLQVLHENNRAKRLYERLGFREIDTLENHFLMEMA